MDNKKIRKEIMQQRIGLLCLNNGNFETPTCSLQCLWNPLSYIFFFMGYHCWNPAKTLALEWAILNGTFPDSALQIGVFCGNGNVACPFSYWSWTVPRPVLKNASLFTQNPQSTEDTLTIAHCPPIYVINALFLGVFVCHAHICPGGYFLATALLGKDKKNRNYAVKFWQTDWPIVTDCAYSNTCTSYKHCGEVQTPNRKKRRKALISNSSSSSSSSSACSFNRSCQRQPYKNS